MRSRAATASRRRLDSCSREKVPPPWLSSAAGTAGAFGLAIPGCLEGGFVACCRDGSRPWPRTPTDSSARARGASPDGSVWEACSSRRVRPGPSRATRTASTSTTASTTARGLPPKPWRSGTPKTPLNRSPHCKTVPLCSSKIRDWRRLSNRAVSRSPASCHFGFARPGKGVSCGAYRGTETAVAHGERSGGIAAGGTGRGPVRRRCRSRAGTR